MTLPSSGSISLAQARTELKSTGAISLGSTEVRKLAGVSSGAISMSQLRGKTHSTLMQAIMSGGGSTIVNNKTTSSGETFKNISAASSFMKMFIIGVTSAKYATIWFYDNGTKYKLYRQSNDSYGFPSYNLTQQQKSDLNILAYQFLSGTHTIDLVRV